jgi:hypothetical protein
MAVPVLAGLALAVSACGALPPRALADWHLHDASGCTNVSYPSQPPVAP